MNLEDPTFVYKLGFSIAIGCAIVAGLLVGALELQALHRRRQLDRPTVRKMLLSLSPLPPTALVSVLMAPVWAALYVGASRFAVLDIPVGAGSVVVALFAADLSYYWEHRCAHRVRVLWGLYHAIHHSCDAYTVATAYRVSFLNQFLAPAFYLPWVLLGLDPILVVGFQLLAFHYQAWLHTETIGPLGPLERWINTPANHRMHHSRAAEHRDVNLGALLMIWDRLFGTYAQPQAGIRHGIPGVEPPDSVLALYTDPWRAFTPNTLRGK